MYEDISGRNPTDDIHELVKKTTDCYILKSIPKEPMNVEFAYYLTHIDKKTFMPFKMEYFKKNDNLYRAIEVKKMEKIEAREKGREISYLAVTMAVATDLESGSKTEMTFSNIRFNIGLNDTIFTERYLRRPPRDAMR